MALYSPKGRQRTTCAVLLLILAAVIVVGVVSYILFAKTPGIPTIVSGSSQTGIGVTTLADGEHIGISDGTFAFDTAPDRADRQLKSQAADDLKKGDTADAERLWQQASQQDTNDAEALIYLEDQTALASPHHITIVVATILTGVPGDIGVGRDDLQGAYIAQKEYNDGHKLNGGVQIRLLIANSGTAPQNATTIAQQIVQAAKHDPTIVGVMGWPYSEQTSSAVNVLATAHIPMVSQTSSSDSLTGASPYFFRIVPPNKTQAIAGANYAEHTLHRTRVALFVDPHNLYSSSLAQDFSDQFTRDGNSIVVTEQYTVGQDNALPGKLTNALSASPTPDLIYFAGYAKDMGVLLTDLPANSPLQVMGGDALYELSGYPSSAREGFFRLHFTSFAYPDEWKILGLEAQQPAFFTVYARDFDPNGQHLVNPYGYDRPDGDAMLSYDAMVVLLEGCNNGGIQASSTPLTPGALQRGLGMINGQQAVQGVSGQISFDSQGNPINKAIVILYVDPTGYIKLVSTNGIQGCFLVQKNCNS